MDYYYLHINWWKRGHNRSRFKLQWNATNQLQPSLALPACLPFILHSFSLLFFISSLIFNFGRSITFIFFRWQMLAASTTTSFLSTFNRELCSTKSVESQSLLCRRMGLWQCEQIGLVVKDFGYKFSLKCSLNMWWRFGYFLKLALFNIKLLWILFGQLLENFDYF